MFSRRDLREEHEVVGDKDERGKALSVNVERGAGIFCKIVIVCFLSVRYRSDGLYCKMAGTPSSPTRGFIRAEIEFFFRCHMLHVEEDNLCVKTNVRCTCTLTSH